MGVTPAADERQTEGSRACGGEGVRSSVKWGYGGGEEGPRPRGDSLGSVVATVVEEWREGSGITGIE